MVPRQEIKGHLYIWRGNMVGEGHGLWCQIDMTYHPDLTAYFLWKLGPKTKAPRTSIFSLGDEIRTCLQGCRRRDVIKYRVCDTLEVLNKEKFYYSSSTLVEAGVIQSEHMVVHVCACVHMCVCTYGPSSNLFGFIHVCLAVSDKSMGEVPGADLWKDIWIEREYGDGLVRCS